MNEPLSSELAAVLQRLKREHDFLPFLQEMVPASEVQLAPLPETMMEQLRTSPDFTRIRPGEPVWLSLSAPDNEAAELVLYRTEANGRHYVIAPKGD